MSNTRATSLTTPLSLNDKKVAIEAAVTDAKKAMHSKLFEASAALAGENKALSKSVAIAQTIYSTQQGIMAAMGATSVADKLLPYPVRLANAIATGAMGAMSIRNIMSESTAGVSDGGGGGGSTPEPMLPASTGAFSLGNVEQPPMKAFVVESEITDSQAQMSDINRRSTI